MKTKSFIQILFPLLFLVFGHNAFGAVNITTPTLRQNNVKAVKKSHVRFFHGKASQNNFSREFFSRGASLCEEGFPSFSLAVWKNCLNFAS